MCWKGVGSDACSLFSSNFHPLTTPMKLQLSTLLTLLLPLAHGSETLWIEDFESYPESNPAAQLAAPKSPISWTPSQPQKMRTDSINPPTLRTLTCGLAK
ncbi:hypothetical protein [Rubritalea tangerina]|uniref:hypothetical protein n=1 Tax=Rubritalea tangerina TaxID=430798 RepID=UPI00361D8059